MLATSARVIVGRPARQRDVADAQLRLRRARRGARAPAAWTAAAGVPETCPDRRSARPASSVQPSNARRAPRRRARRAIASPTAMTVVRDGMNARRWNALMSRIISERSAPFGADRQVAVGMIAIEQLREGAIGERRRHVLQLQQPVQPQVADAIELALLEPRPDQHVAHQLEAATEIALERRQRRGPSRRGRPRCRAARRSGRALRARRAPSDRRRLRRACRR